MLDMALHYLQLSELQALRHTSQVFRLPAQTWQHSAARTVPAWHPLAAGPPNVPAVADSLCAASAALAQGSISSQSLGTAEREVLLLKPDFAGCGTSLDNLPRTQNCQSQGPVQWLH